MGRTREFDEAEALARATDAFWELGYENASLCTLVARTGLSRSSLYQAFGNKHAVFLKALDRYLQEGREQLQRALGSNRKSIAEWLSSIAESSTGEQPRGCFAVNAASELGAHDEEVRTMLVEHNRAFDAIVASAIRAGIDAGDIQPTVDPESTALAFRVASSGLQVAGKAGLERQEAMRVTTTLMALIPPPLAANDYDD